MPSTSPVSHDSETGADSCSRPLARKSPPWLASAVIYQIFLRSFTPEGTLNAARERLPELKELGVDVLYLCPICLQDDDPRREFWSKRQAQFDNPKNPYRIKDYYAIDLDYGTGDDLREFVSVAHRYGMRVLLDIVFLHCGPSAVFLKEHPDYVKREPDGSFALAGWNFPKLNFDHPGLREHLLLNLEYWIREFAVDGYRCDVSDAVPLDFWETARSRLEALLPEVVMLAEGERREDQLAAFDLNYCFTWTASLRQVFNQGGPASILRATWETLEAERPRRARFIRYIDNHDIAHDTAQGREDADWQPGKRLERAWGSDAIEALLAFTFALDGIPFLYNGQEVADDTLHNLFGHTAVDWGKLDTPAGRGRFDFVRRLIALRHEEPLFPDGNLRWVSNDAPDALLMFVRDTPEEQALVMVNLSSGPVRGSLELSAGGDAFRPLLASGVSLTGQSATFAPFAYFIGKRRK